MHVETSTDATTPTYVPHLGGCPSASLPRGSSSGHPGADAEVAVAEIDTRRRLAAARS